MTTLQSSAACLCHLFARCLYLLLDGKQMYTNNTLIGCCFISVCSVFISVPLQIFICSTRSVTNHALCQNLYFIALQCSVQKLIYRKACAFHVASFHSDIQFLKVYMLPDHNTSFAPAVQYEGCAALELTRDSVSHLKVF